LKTRVEDVLEIFQKDGYSILTSEEAIKYLPHEFPSKKCLKRDPDVNSLLLFPPTTTFFDHDLFKSGQIILQDKVC
jgi:putative methyltransferase